MVAIVDDGAATTHGFGTGSALTSSARLCAQFRYDPYGSLLSVQGLQAFPDPRTGHKGLHIDRLDAGVADPLTGAPIARHVDPSTLPGGGASAAGGGLTHRYFVRNRHYAPDLGRFMQRDPNETAQLAGRLPTERLGVSLSLVDHVKDGCATYQYVGGQPWGYSDPWGLERGYDPFDWVDEYIAEDAGARAAYMEDVISGFNAMAHIAWQVAQMHPAIGLAVTVANASRGNVSILNLATLVPGGALAKVGRGLGGAGGSALIGKAFATYGQGIARMKGKQRLLDDAIELHHVVPVFMTGWNRSGRVIALSARDHRKYHEILRMKLRDHGLPSQNDGLQVWKEFMRTRPDQYPAVQKALMESVEVFRRRTGIDMVKDLWQEMHRQGFALVK